PGTARPRWHTNCDGWWRLCRIVSRYLPTQMRPCKPTSLRPYFLSPYGSIVSLLHLGDSAPESRLPLGQEHLQLCSPVQFSSRRWHEWASPSRPRCKGGTPRPHDRGC